MRTLFSELERPLPQALLDDLTELLTWDNNAFLTWVRTDDDIGGNRWFTVSLSSDGRQFGLRLEFWIPEWMTARGVTAILPAHLQLAECRLGTQATVDLGMRPWADVKASLPRVARTAARLMNELWGLTETDAVLLLAMEYQDELLETPFTQIPGYGK